MASDIVPPSPEGEQESNGDSPIHMTHSEALWMAIMVIHFLVFRHPRADYSNEQLLAGMNILWVEYLRVKLDESGIK